MRLWRLLLPLGRRLDSGEKGDVEMEVGKGERRKYLLLTSIGVYVIEADLYVHTS